MANEVECRSEIVASVWKVRVDVGQRVDANHELAVLESMKMEIPVHAPVAGIVIRVLTAEGAQVAEGDVLFVLET